PPTRRSSDLFPSRYACPSCGYSLGELEPRLFSFNNPSGACPGCDGLGSKQFFDPSRVVAHPERSLAAGAIRGWDRRNPYFFQLISSLAAHYGFDIDTPFEQLPERLRNVILYGSGDEAICFSYVDSRGREQQRRHPFEGVLPNLERRYRETESALIREELARYLSDQPCPDCGGTRLNRAARHVYIGDQNLPSISRMPVAKALRFFEQLQLPGSKGA